MTIKSRARVAGRKRGTSLVELSMAMVMIGLLVPVLPGFYLGSVRLWQREVARGDAATSAGAAIDRMHEDVRNARSVSIFDSGRTLQLTLPKRTYDASLGRYVNALGSDQALATGGVVRYRFVSKSGSSGGRLYRDVADVDDASDPADDGDYESRSGRLVAEDVYPQLNPAQSGSLCPLFAYDSARRTVTVTLTVAEKRPSRGDFAAASDDPKCVRCGRLLTRVISEQHPEGLVQCTSCGDLTKADAETATYRTRLLVRNQ